MASLNGSRQPESFRTYQAFGFNLISDFPFRHHLGESRGKADISFTLAPPPVEYGFWKDEPPIYRSPRLLKNGESVSRLFRLDSWEIFSFPLLADFYLQRDCIVSQLIGQPNTDLLEIRFLGPVLSYWLERRGLLTLHASAVVAKGRAIGFLSRHGGGKTGLAAELMRSGCSLLTDDILAVEEIAGTFNARPGYAQMRMWPEEASNFDEHWEALPFVLPGLAKRRVPVGKGGFGSFQRAPVPLACIYLASRRPEGEGGVEIQPVSRSEALIELVRHSFSPRLVEAAGLQPSRLDRLSRLVRQVPVRRLSYPSGFERLPEVAEALLGSW